jgi:hypothetical protein
MSYGTPHAYKVQLDEALAEIKTLRNAGVTQQARIDELEAELKESRAKHQSPRIN